MGSRAHWLARSHRRPCRMPLKACACREGGWRRSCAGLFELAKNVDSDRKACSHGGGLGVLDTLDDVLQESISSGVSVAILYVQ